MSDIEAKDVLIKNDNASLFALSQSEPVFVRSTKDVNIYDPSGSSFFFHAQYQFAKDFIFVPLTKFENVAKEELESLSSKTNEFRSKKNDRDSFSPSIRRCFSNAMFFRLPWNKSHE